MALMIFSYFIEKYRENGPNRTFGHIDPLDGIF